MKIVFYLYGNKLSRKNLNNLLGAPAVRELVLCAKEVNLITPIKEKSFDLGSYGVLVIGLDKEENIKV